LGTETGRFLIVLWGLRSKALFPPIKREEEEGCGAESRRNKHQLRKRRKGRSLILKGGPPPPEPQPEGRKETVISAPAEPKKTGRQVKKKHPRGGKKDPPGIFLTEKKAVVHASRKRKDGTRNDDKGWKMRLATKNRRELREEKRERGRVCLAKREEKVSTGPCCLGEEKRGTRLLNGGVGKKKTLTVDSRKKSTRPGEERELFVLEVISSSRRKRT